MTTPDGRPLLDRRAVLGGLAAGAGVGWLATLAGCVNGGRRARVATKTAGAREPNVAAGGSRVLTAAEWRTLEAALDVMLPSGPGSPGARDVNGIGYLDAALADPDTEAGDAALVRAGAAWLDEAARRAGSAHFAAAPPDLRETALAAVAARDRGPDWVLVTLMFGLEALLGDPVHGGNPGEVGWRWLGHTPGEPRPSAKAVEGMR
jgi:hypothetical protein